MGWYVDANDVVTEHCDRCGKCDQHTTSFRANSLARLKDMGEARSSGSVDLCFACAEKALRAACSMRLPRSYPRNTKQCIGCKGSDAPCDASVWTPGGRILFMHACYDCLRKLANWTQTDRPDSYQLNLEGKQQATSLQKLNELAARSKSSQHKSARLRERGNERTTITFGGSAMWGFGGYLSQVQALCWQLGLSCEVIKQRGLLGTSAMFRVSGKRRNVEQLQRMLSRY